MAVLIPLHIAFTASLAKAPQDTRCFDTLSAPSQEIKRAQCLGNLAQMAASGRHKGTTGTIARALCRGITGHDTPLERSHTEAGSIQMKLALYQPDIPQNTGTILRMCACLGVPAHIIGPAGFDFSDRALRRAGLDYLEHADLVRHVGWQDFVADRAADADRGRLVLLTTQAELCYVDYRFNAADTLLVGRESAGVPEAVHGVADARIRIPVRPGLRSLNVAVAAAMVLGEALRQTDALRTPI